MLEEFIFQSYESVSFPKFLPPCLAVLYTAAAVLLTSPKCRA